jgi:GWxTD domain-containing protein
MRLLSPTPFFRRTAVAFAVALLLPGARAQGVDSLIAAGDSLFSAGHFQKALAAFESACEKPPPPRKALLGLGRTALALELWGDAKDAFTAIVEADTGDIEGHYYAGIAYRELGKTKAWILRNMDWASSRENFAYVLAHDSAYADALLEYALLMECRGDYPAALAAGHAQIMKRPDLVPARIGLFRLYRSFVANDRASAINWLRKEGTPIAIYFLAEAERRENRPGESEKILRDLASTRTLPLLQPVYLSLARIEVRRGAADSAVAEFWNAVDEIATQLGADLIFEDLKYLVTDREAARYRRLQTPADFRVFFRSFWDARNPASTGNAVERIAEHYRRLLYAEENYEYTGFRTGFTNPDRFHDLVFPASYTLNQEFNDKGLIYIRHGAPTSTQRSTGGVDQSESWLYEGTPLEPRRIFHFQKKNSVGNNWRLMPYPDDPALLFALSSWDVHFVELIGPNASAAEKARDALRDEGRTTVAEALATDEHTWTKEITPFTFPHAIDAFRGKSGKALLDVSYALPLALLEPGGTTGVPVRSEVGIALRTRRGETHLARLDTITIPAARDAKDTYLNLYRFILPPEAYSVAMHVRPIGGKSFGSWKEEKVIPPATEGLAMSDIQYLLPSAVRTTLDIDGVKVVPSPFARHATDAPLYVYVHAYGLVRDADGKSSYTVRYVLIPLGDEGAPPPFDPENPGDRAIVLQEKTRDATEETAQIFGTLDISRVDEGRYALAVVLKDRKRVQTIVAQRVLDIYEP